MNNYQSEQSKATPKGLQTTDNTMIDPATLELIAALAPIVVTPVVELLKPSASRLGLRLADSIFPVKDDSRYQQAMVAYAERDIQIREQELEARQEFSKDLLDLVRELQASQIQLQLQKFQAIFDQQNLATILSREDSYKILVEGQKKHRLLVLASPPKVSPNCPQWLQHDLLIELPEDLQTFLSQHYPLSSDLCPVEFFGGFFRRPIVDVDIPLLQKILAKVPTAIIYNQITNDRVFFHVRFWGLKNSIIERFDLSAWNWKEDGYNALINAGEDEAEALYKIGQIIIAVNQLLTAFVTDYYYLNINPLYEPQLFQLNSAFPEEWVNPYIEVLREVYRLNQSGIFYNRGLRLTGWGRYEEAVASFKEALEFQPESHEALCYQGLALFKLERLEEARASFDKAIEINPDYREACYYRGLFPVGMGSYEFGGKPRYARNRTLISRKHDIYS